MPLALVIDTAFDRCQIGLFKDETCLAHYKAVATAGRHDQILAVETQKILANHHIRLADVERVIVTTGPGRFTGLRVGLAFARGLVLPYGTVLTGVLVPDVLAVQYQARVNASYPTAVILSAKRGESFVHILKPEPDPITVISDTALGVYLEGCGVRHATGIISPETQDILKTIPHLTCDPEFYPDLEVLYRLGYQTEHPRQLAPVRPYYAAGYTGA